jgi:short-subunit dehydrogenase
LYKMNKSHQKTILITGISTGIGRAFIQLAYKELDAHIIAITKHPLEYELPPNVEVHFVDLTDHKAVARTVEKVLRKHPVIDVLINNAGNGWRGTVEDTTIAEAKEQLEVNVWAVLNLTQLILPSMRANNSGHIINITSVAATINYATIGYYSATKSFIEKISEVLALETAQWNIQVSLLAPGTVKTKFGHNMRNIKRYGKGDYKQLYDDWAHKFEVMFQDTTTSEVAGRELVRLVKRPKPYTFLTTRDALYCAAKRVLPKRFFERVVLKRYMGA